MKSKTYFLVLRDGEPTELVIAEGKPKAGILMFGSIATLFTDKQQATKAINRTVKYASSLSYHWGDKDIYTVEQATVAA